MGETCLPLQLQWTVRTDVDPSPRVMRVAAMFGLGVEGGRDVRVVPPIKLTLRPGQVVFITGPSGGGKSSILRLISNQLLHDTRVRVMAFHHLPEPAERPLVDVFDHLPLERAVRVLSLAGLGDAFVMLRRPSELSDGQRYRLRLAQVMAMAEEQPGHPASNGQGPLMVVLADEFGATLDRLTATVIARNIRRWVSRCLTPVCFVAATTHDDLLEPLEPDTLIEKGLGESVEVLERNPTLTSPKP
ncbi:MAG: ATP-binding cassette domain-containing protein [Phycisphaera sp.]|nr:ATP-binding cassette domain-containing protein [Phycisphaera sp.]